MMRPGPPARERSAALAGRGLISALAGVLLIAQAGGVGAASPGREGLDRAIRHIRDAQAQVRQPGREPQVDELLGRARDRLSRHDDDRDIRRAAEHVDRAIAVLRDGWRSPFDKARQVREEGDHAVRLIRQSRAYAAGEPRPADPGRVRIGAFTKQGFEGERFSASIARQTADRAFARVVLVVSAGERGFTPIVNTIQVRVGGRWVEHPVRYRTTPGENVLAIDTPRGATEILFSLDHGKGATLEAFLA
jgi:hypothetical protein